jgi:hypothetical protein
MVHGARAEPWVETFGAKGLEILYHPRPQVKNIIPESYKEV